MTPRYRAVQRWRGLVVAIALATIVIGCSSPKQRYKVLSLFFDGVPDPDATANAQGTRRVSASGKPIYIHKPYADQKCDSCHLNTSDILARARVRPNVCMDCHAGVQGEHKVMHGPVAANLCTYCHAPHQTSEPFLLKTSSRNVCIQCHLPETLSVKVPEHVNKKSVCIDCHSGHGGDDRRFLKVAATQPTTREVRP